MKSKSFKKTPHESVESILRAMYENMRDGGGLPSNLLWSDIYTIKDIKKISKPMKNLADYEEEAYNNFRNIQLLQQFDNFNRRVYKKVIAERVAIYRVVEDMKSILWDITLKRENLFADASGHIYKQPGRNEDTLFKLFIRDLFNSSKEYIKNDQDDEHYFNSMLAFYLAKIDIFQDLKCKFKQKQSSDLCSETDCLKSMRNICMNDLTKIYSKFKSNPAFPCYMDFSYASCINCRWSLNNLMDTHTINKKIRNGVRKATPLFLRTPCKAAVDRLNSIIEALKRDKYKGIPIGIHITDIEIYAEQYRLAISSNSKKAKTSVLNTAQESYPHISRKEILRIITQS